MANNWKEICARCIDGDIEPRYCEYYSEPNGCNSPIYGEHPSTPNAVAMRSCLIKILAEMIDLGGMEVGRKARFSPDAIAEEIRQACAVPPRNCDLHTADELKAIFKSELVSELPIANEHEKNLVMITANGVIDTLFATTKKGGNNANE